MPADIKDTFDRLGIPAAERESLAGVGAQYDSEIVYHNMREDVAKQGVVYTTIEDALHDPQWEPVVHEYFGTLIPPTDHKFAALHYAVWSGGSFVYVPAGVTLDYPLQSYFRLNAQGAGQFEHTLIIVEPGADLHFIEGCSAPKYFEANLHAGAVELFVKDGARLRYSTIENWSKNMYNLNTKRAKVGADAKMEWVSGSFGSHVSYLYPTTIMEGARSSCEFTGITFAGATQDLDTGCKVVMNGPDTTATVNTKSISKDGGINTFRSSVVVGRRADRARCSVSCQSLMLDDISRSDTIPAMDVRNATAQVGHEATIGRISDDTILYLMSRGCSEADGRGHRLMADEKNQQAAAPAAADAGTVTLERVSTPPASTWNRLRANDITLTVPSISRKGDVHFALPQLFSKIECGMGQKVTDWVCSQAADSRYVEVPRGAHREEPIVVSVSADEGQVADTGVMVREGASATIVVAASGQNQEGTCASLLRVVAEARSHVTIVEVLGVAEGQQHLESLGVSAAADARVEVRQYALGGGTLALGSAIDLAGDRARADLTCRYHARRKDVLDINHVVRQRGRNTRAEVSESGALDDAARKTLRATIDLVHGARGSKGNEAESVLVLGDDVVNKTMPVILCDEDDVAGNHGATIGSVSPEQIDYLMDRGLSRREAEQLFVRAIFEDAIMHAPEEASHRAAVLRTEEVLGADVAHDFDEGAGLPEGGEAAC